jgi:CBS domain-containing protein
MNMSIGDICDRDVAIAGCGATVQKAARLLRNSGTEVLVVVEDHGDACAAVGLTSLAGIVREIVAEAVDPACAHLGDVMTTEFARVCESESVHDAVRLMCEHGLEYVVVVDSAGHLTGVVTVRQLFESLAGDGLTGFTTLLEDACARPPVPEARAIPASVRPGAAQNMNEARAI